MIWRSLSARAPPTAGRRPADPEMAETPFPKAPGPAGTQPPSATGDGAEVLDKLQALLGRLRGTESAGEHPPALAEIPTLHDPVYWTTPSADLQAIPAGGHIPTLTEPVEVDGSLPAIAPPPLPVTASTSSVAMHPPVPMEAPTPMEAPVPMHPPASLAEPDREAELRQRIASLLDPDLQQRLCERAIADLERTLIDVERSLRDELAAWRDEQASRIHDQVRAEVERALDQAVADLARHGGGNRPA
jgi:hypothetical protein